MIKTDPIIAVQDVEKSSQWYQSLLGCTSNHSGSKFAILVDENQEVILCLHKWGEHEHPTLTDSTISPGNGLLLYLRTDKIHAIREQATAMKCTIEVELNQNPNTGTREFSIRDLDGYYLTFSDYHTYGG